MHCKTLTDVYNESLMNTGGNIWILGRAKFYVKTNVNSFCT